MNQFPKNYRIRTPDGEIIEFAKLNRSEASEILKRSEGELLKTKNFFQDKAYLINNGNVIYEVSLDGYLLLFENESVYANYTKGTNYFATSVIFDSEDNIHSSFYLMPDKVRQLIKQYDYKITDTYPSSDNYQCYINNTNECVMYLRPRGGDLMEG